MTKRKDSGPAVIVILALIAVVVVFAALVAAHWWLYGDWRCVFIECRKVVP
jgi:hypothetical protein